MSKITIRNYKSETFQKLYTALLMAYGFITEKNNGWLSLYCFNDDGETITFILRDENFSCKYEKIS